MSEVFDLLNLGCILLMLAAVLIADQAGMPLWEIGQAFRTSLRPTAWLAISDLNFDVRRENSSL
jgi:hypothetical protein